MYTLSLNNRSTCSAGEVGRHGKVIVSPITPKTDCISPVCTNALSLAEEKTILLLLCQIFS